MAKMWSYEQVLNALRLRRDASKSLSCAAIAYETPDLRNSLLHYRGGWSGALRAIGENPDRWRHHRVWTRESIIDELRLRAAAGTLKLQRVMKEDGSLARAARRRFGLWFAAIEAAGLDPAKFRDCKEHRVWSPDAVRKAIADRIAAGLPIRGKRLQDQDSGLFCAGVLYFGSWKHALDPEAKPVRQVRRPITAEDIIRVIRERHSQGLPVCEARMEPRNLIYLGHLKLGSWSNVLRAAGLDPEVINLHKKWSAERVVSAIHDRLRAEIPINSCHVRRGEFQDARLYAAALLYFRSWDNAIIAAGIAPATVRLRRQWSLEVVVNEIRQRARSGARMNCSAVDHEDQRLLQAATRHFGSWSAALAYSGLKDVRSYRKPWTRSAIIIALRECEARGASFSQLPSSCERSAKRLFGSWSAAVRAAFPNCSSEFLSRAKPADVPPRIASI